MSKDLDGWGTFAETAQQASRGASGCGVGKLIDMMRMAESLGDRELPKGAADSLVTAMANPDITANGIIRALQARLDVSWSIPRVATFQRHRKGACGCGA